jgi:hypothetical protein
MSSGKSAYVSGTVDPTRKKIRFDRVGEATRSSSRRLSQIAVEALEIAPDYEVDCDPYNRSGQYCVLDIDR